MAGRADIVIDAVPALQLRPIEGAERPVEGPALGLDHWLIVIVGGRRGGRLVGGMKRCRGPDRDEQGGDGKASQCASPQCHSTCSRWRALGTDSGNGSSGPSTDSVMLPGSLAGFSSRPTTGITTRKNKK